MKTSNKDESPADRIWRFFASVRLSVVLLLTLAATSIIGTLIPQNADPAAYEKKFGQPLYTVFEALNLFDMYRSWWFRLLLCLLIANLIVCSIRRLKTTWKTIFPKKPNYQPERFRKSSGRIQWKVESAQPRALKQSVEPYIRGRLTNVSVKNPGSGGSVLIFGEKGRWTRLGVYGVHFSVLLLMTGALIGSIFGYEGQMNVPVGEIREQFSLENTNQSQKLDFAVRCDDFEVSHYPSGRPRDYRSDIAIIENGKVVRKHQLRVNDPLTHKGVTMYQSTYGRIPGDQLTVVLTESSTGERHEKKTSMGETIQMPNGRGELTIEDYSGNFAFRGHNIGPAFLARLVPESGRETPVLLPVEHPSFDKMRRGEYEISVKDVDFRYYTGLQIKEDPGVPVVYTGFLIMIIGCYITFFMSHRKMCVELQPEGSGTRISVAGISTRNRMGTKNAVKKLSRKIEKITSRA
ncbi:MAG: cytochrome c biogenesis protein ResB [Desulfosalsimonas sp.]